MTVTAIVELQFTPESVPAAYDALRETLADTRAFAGNLGVEVIIDRNDAGHVALVERWETIEAVTAYRAFRRMPGNDGGLGPHLAGPPTAADYDDSEI
jgi:quinol monooxygenase YgiN